MTLRGHFFLKKNGVLSENEKGTSLFNCKILGGHMPPVPPGSYVYDQMNGSLSLSQLHNSLDFENQTYRSEVIVILFTIIRTFGIS